MKKILIVPFFLLLCFITGQTFVAAAELSEEDFLELLPKVDPYVQLDENRIATIDKETALANGITPEELEVAVKIFDEQNRLMEAVKGNVDIINDFEVSNEVDSYTEPYFEELTGQYTPSEAYDEYASKKAESEGAVYEAATKENVYKAAVSTSCVGSKTNPHKCPPRMTRREDVNYTTAKFWLDVTAGGYHRTRYYAGGGLATSLARDFTKPLTAYDCSSRYHGAFRSQVVFASAGNKAGEYDIVQQHPEPNPEIDHYIWPSAGWGIYVKWWHDNYC